MPLSPLHVSVLTEPFSLSDCRRTIDQAVKEAPVLANRGFSLMATRRYASGTSP